MILDRLHDYLYRRPSRRARIRRALAGLRSEK